MAPSIAAMPTNPILWLTLAAACLSGGCVAAQSPTSGGIDTRVHEMRNPHTTPVVRDNGDGTLTITKPPALRFTGISASVEQVKAWARDNGITAAGIYADGRYAQLESESAIQLAHWLKRALYDLDYTYYADARDCDNFARIFRAFPDFFARDDGAQALVFGLYARMDVSFAGVRDGYHALNAAWTDRGVFVFEPQGWESLIFQDIRAWPNKPGITSINSD